MQDLPQYYIPQWFIGCCYLNIIIANLFHTLQKHLE